MSEMDKSKKKLKNMRMKERKNKEGKSMTDETKMKNYKE